MEISIKERDVLLKSLRMGMAPKIGLQHIQVDRADEIKAMIDDLELIANGSAVVRFIIGPYGSGKTFFLHLTKLVSIAKGFITTYADITLERRFARAGGSHQATALYSEFMNNLAYDKFPDGGGLEDLLQNWLRSVERQTEEEGGDSETVALQLKQLLEPLNKIAKGHEFVRILGKYFEGIQNEDHTLKEAALRWLKAEYETKSSARDDLGIKCGIIEDSNILEYIKLFATFVVIAGYSGLIVSIDEVSVIPHHLMQPVTRNNNYAWIRNLMNDCITGQASQVGFILAGADELFDDQRRGFFSYRPLRDILKDDLLALSEDQDFTGPVIRLGNLGPEDLYLLLEKIRHVHALGDEQKYVVPDEAIVAFMAQCRKILGAESFLTPREVVKSYIRFLKVLENNHEKNWQELLDIDVLAQLIVCDGDIVERNTDDELCDREI
jgi:hypothetical protein